MCGCVSSTPSLVAVGPMMPTTAMLSTKKTTHLKKYSRTEEKLIDQYLPSFCFREKSNETDSRTSGAHWNLVFRDAMRSGVSAKSDSRQSQAQTSTITQLYDVFYEYLDAEAPELKSVFRASMHVRGRVLVHISAGMRTLLRADNVVDRVLPLTRTHLQSGVKPEHFDPLGQALMRAMRVVSGDHWSLEVEDSWRRMFCHTSVLLIKAHVKAQGSVLSTSKRLVTAFNGKSARDSTTYVSTMSTR